MSSDEPNMMLRPTNALLMPSTSVDIDQSFEKSVFERSLESLLAMKTAVFESDFFPASMRPRDIDPSMP